MSGYHDHSLIEEFMPQRKRCKSLAKMHIFFKLLVNLAVEVVSMSEETV